MWVESVGKVQGLDQEDALEVRGRADVEEPGHLRSGSQLKNNHLAEM